jgi:malonyl CoA-acyl carrier protein transacylase
MLAFVFPGQGSQSRGMGGELFDAVPQFVEAEPEIDRLLGYSLRRMCTANPDNRLQDTRYTQPCLYVINALHYFHTVARGETPAFVAGHSLGEYNALLAAGAFDFLTGLRLVARRGELMAVARDGAMAAVVGLDQTRVAHLIRANRFDALDVANINSPTQIVISGPADEITRAGPVFEKAGAALYVRLPVSAAFHSRYMKDAAATFSKFLESFEFRPLKVPVIANVTGLPYPSADPATTIRSLLAEQIYRPVQWVSCVGELIARGAAPIREIGPGNVLTKLNQQIQRARAA